MNILAHIKRNRISYILSGVVLAILIIICWTIKCKHSQAKLSGIQQEPFTNNEKPQPAKIAFLFLTRDNLRQPEIWQAYFAGHEGKYTIYNHAKNPEKVRDPVLSGHTIPENTPTEWGNIGTVRANILMMKHAMTDPANRYFILCSESCVPVTGFDKFYNFLLDAETGSRSVIPYFTEHAERYNSIKVPRLKKEQIRKHCAQGLIFSRDHADILVNNDDTDNCANIHCIDEHYFYNTLIWKGVNPDTDIRKYKATFDIWSVKGKNGHVNDPAFPQVDYDISRLKMPGYADFASITPEFLAKIREAGFFFFRKVSPGSELESSSKLYFREVI